MISFLIVVVSVIGVVVSVCYGTAAICYIFGNVKSLAKVIVPCVEVIISTIVVAGIFSIIGSLALSGQRAEGLLVDTVYLLLTAAICWFACKVFQQVDGDVNRAVFH